MTERIRAIKPTYLPGREAHEQGIAEKIAATGLPHCYMCGKTLAECDQQSEAQGFDECEWLAAK